MLEAELLPELHADLVPALSHLERDDLPRHFSETRVYGSDEGNDNSLFLFLFSRSGAREIFEKEGKEMRGK
jgi:hypothetical protein